MDNNGNNNNMMMMIESSMVMEKSFVEVEKILDENRVLISEINKNHESKIAENLGRNVGLIRDLNNNIRRVVDLYAHLSTSFTKSILMDHHLLQGADDSSTGAPAPAPAPSGFKRHRHPPAP